MNGGTRPAGWSTSLVAELVQQNASGMYHYLNHSKTIFLKFKNPAIFTITVDQNAPFPTRKI